MKTICLKMMMTALLLITVSGSSLFSATITIDASKQFQTIEGFGGFGPAKVWWDAAPFYTDAWVRLMIDTLGLTMLRTTVPASFEFTNDNSDPNVMNMAAYQTYAHVAGEAETHLGDHLPFYRAMKAEADRTGEQFKIISTIWTPPAWMKSNGEIRNGGNLLPAQYSEFAERCAAYVKVIKAETGIDIYAFNIQNEPAFVEPYESCVYTAETYRDALKVTAARFVRESLVTKFFLPEEVLAQWASLRGRITTAMADTGVANHVQAIAFHGYQANGITPASPDVNAMRSLATLVGGYRKGLWMSETSGQGTDWAGGYSLAKGLFNALKYGNLTGWTYWYLADDFANSSASGCTKLFYTMKSFYRYIRPGAVRIDAATSDTNVQAVAFAHPAKRTVTYVVINTGSSAVTIDLAGAGLPASMRLYRTSSSENCADKGTMAISGLSLPANTINTLVGANYDLPATGVMRTAVRSAPLRTSAVTGMFTLRGERSGSGLRLTDGCYIARRSDGAARIAVGRSYRKN